MNPIVEFLRKTDGTVFVDEGGKRHTFRLSPGLSEQELCTFEMNLPCTLPDEMRELLRFARGCEGLACRLGRRFALQEIGFADFQGFGLGNIFPHGKELAVDGCGNSWVVDLTSESKTFAPIFFSCHDPPVIVHQAESLLHFVSETVRGSNAPWKSDIADMYNGFAGRIYRQNPLAQTRSQSLATGESELRAFAESLDETWEFIDLRNPKMGDGYSWGIKDRRSGNMRIFAHQKKKNLGQRFLETFR